MVKKTCFKKKTCLTKNPTWEYVNKVLHSKRSTPTQKNDNKPWHCAARCGGGAVAVRRRCGMMAMAHLWTSPVALALAVPVPAGEGGTLALLESCRGWAVDVSACAARSRCWRVPAAAVAVA
jgi:hypothetical protein